MRYILTFIIGMSGSLFAQENRMKIALIEGETKEIKYKDWSINALLIVYDETAKTHLNGDVSLSIKTNINEPIVNFYVNNDSPKTDCYTKIYGKYLLTFLIENDSTYLVIEPAQLGEIFVMSSHNVAVLHCELDSIEIEITDVIHEWGYDLPDSDGNSNYFSDVVYTLKVKTNQVVTYVEFNSSELKNKYFLDVEGYSIVILSEKYHDTYSEIEMIIMKKLSNRNE